MNNNVIVSIASVANFFWTHVMLLRIWFYGIFMILLDAYYVYKYIKYKNQLFVVQ